MPTNKHLLPLDFTVQICGSVSTYQADEAYPYPPELLEEKDRKQIKTFWELTIGAHLIKTLQQKSVRPDIKLIETLWDVGCFNIACAVEHVISNKFSDAAFAVEFENSLQ